MYKWVLFAMAAVLLVTNPLWAQFPPVPGTVDPVRVNWFSDEADFFIWTQDQKLYLRAQLVSQEFFVCSVLFGALQSDGAGGFGGGKLTVVREEGGASVCENITADETFLVENDGSPMDLTKPLEVYFDNGDKTILIDVFTVGSKLAPINGIWRSSDPPLSIYIQKYQAASAIAVATQDGINLVAFLDSNIADGFSQTNDVANQGFGISITLQDSTHGTATVDLPSGEVTADISLVFPDLR